MPEGGADGCTGIPLQLYRVQPESESGGAKLLKRVVRLSQPDGPALAAYTPDDGDPCAVGGRTGQCQQDRASSVSVELVGPVRPVRLVCTISSEENEVVTERSV